MCLTPGKGTPATASTDGGTATPVANGPTTGPGQTQGNSIGAPPADGVSPISSDSHNGENTNGTAASSTTTTQVSSTSKTSDSATHSNSASAKVAATTLTPTGGAKTSPTPSGAGTPTLKLKGSLTSSIASKFGGNTAVFPKLGVGGLTSPKIGGGVNGSLAAKKFELAANNSSTTSSSSTKVEFAAVKLKKVSKITTSISSSSSSSNSSSSSTTVQDKTKTKTIDEKQTNDTAFFSPKVASETAASKKTYFALSSKSSSDDQSVDSIKSVKETEADSINTKSPSDISAKSSKLLSVQNEKTQSTETLNKTVSSAKSISESSSRGSTESLSSSSVKSVCERASSAASSVLSGSNITSSSSSSSYHSSSSSTKTVITSSIISSSSTSSSHSSSVSTSSINSNALCRSTTIKNSDIPAIASKTLIALSNAGEEQSGDTEIKVITSVKKVKKSLDPSVKKKKKKVSGRDSEGKEIPIIEEGTTESPAAPGKTELSKQADQDCGVIIKVVSSSATTKENETKNLSKSTLVNGVAEEASTLGVSEASVLKRDKKSVAEATTKTATTTVSSDSKSFCKVDRIAQGNDEIIVLKKGKKGGKASPLVSKKETMAVSSPTAGSASAIATLETTSSATPPVLPSPKSPSTSSDGNVGVEGLTSSPSEIANDLQSSLASLSLDSGVSSSASAEAGTSSLDEVINNTDSVQQGGSGTTCDLSISGTTSTTAAISIPNCANVPSSLSSSPSVCSLSTATDTLSTSTSDLSISPPASMPPCTGGGGGVTAASIMSTSTTTLSSTSTNLPATCVTTSTTAHPVALPTAADGVSSSAVDGSSAPGGERGTSGWFLPSTLFTSNEPVTVIVRDMSSITLSINRTSISTQGSSTVRSLLVEVGHRFGYEPDSFSLTMQNTRITDLVELERLDPYTTLEAAGFIVDGVSRNSLLLSDLRGTAPKKTGADPAAGSRDDDLALGASASPTSCGGGKDSGMYSSTSTTGASSRHKKHVWPDLDVSTSSGAAAASTSSSHEYTKYTYGCGTSKQDTGYVGLVNQAMTCYLNSLLQTLYMTPEFRNALYRWEFKGSKEEGYKSIPFQLQKLFLLLQTTDRSAVETTRLTRSFGWDSSEAWQQHDIQELCRVMFEALEQSFANTDQANLIDTLYQGKMKDYVKCLACGNENARMDSFLDIPLPIRPFGSSTAYQSLEEALRAFVTPELLSGTNQYRCSNCDSMCDAHKGLAFTRYPYLLTIHLKRFDFDYQTFHRIKLNDRVTFPNQLDLSEYLDVPTKDEEDAMSPSTDAVVASSSTTPGGGGGVCSSNKSDSAASSGGPLDDAATDDSGSALDNEDSSLVDFTPPHNTTQEEDEGIDLTTASDTERSSNDKVKGSKKSGATKKEQAAVAVSSLSGANSQISPADGISVEVSSKDNIGSGSSISNVDGTRKNEEKNTESSKDFSTAEVNPDDIRQDERYTTYQLFSIMIHSGSASGGHYYAYVKDFVTEDWFCFNDQSVTRISDDDIKRTYGSGTRGITGFAASANAYMLMYRQINDKMNVLPFDKDNFPVHVKKLCSSLVEEEEQEREARERERCTCVIKLFCHHPATAHLSDMKLRVHKDATLAEATRQAHQELELYKSVPIERCRLVKYEEYQDSLESSFEDQDDKPMSEVLGGVKSSYKFDLLMEVREESQKFEVYRPGGLSVKVYVVSLTGCGEVEGPHIIRGTLTMTVAELKQAIGRSLNLNSENMRIVAEGFYNEMKLLADDALQLRTEGLYRSSKVFVEASGEESIKSFIGSQMSSVIDRYQNTITLYCNLPEVSPAILTELKIPPYCEEAVTLPQPQAAVTAGTAAASIEESASSSTIEDSGAAPTTDVTATLAAGAAGCDGSGEATALTAGTAAVTAVTAVVDTATTAMTPVESPVVSNVTNTSTNAGGSSPLPPSQPPTTPTTNTSMGDTAACSTSSNNNNNTSVTGATTGTSSAITNVNTNNSLFNINTSSNSSNINISLSSQKQNLTLPVPSTSVFHSPSSLSSSTNSASASATASSSSEAHLSSDAPGHCNLVIVGTSIPVPSPGGLATPGDGGAGGSGGGANLSDGEDDDGACGGGYSTLSSDQSTSEDSSLTSDSDRTLVGDPPEDDRLSDRCNSPDYHNVSSPEEPSAKVGGSSWSAGIGCDDDVRASASTGLTGDVAVGTALWAVSPEDPPWNGDGDLQPVKRYFKAKALAGSDNPDERVLEMRVDNRMTVDQLKAAMQPHVGVPQEHFKLYKKYTQEFECSRGGEMVKNFGECGRLVAKLDRALQEGEYRGKVYMLDMSNTAEPARFLIDFVLRESDTIAGVKAAIVKEVNSSCGLSLTVDGVRLRRKSWKNPQTVYLDHQVFGERDITLHNNWELFIQERALPELKTNCHDDQLVLFVRRWRPSQYRLDPIVELLVPENSGQVLRQKLSEVSGIPADNVQVAKGRNTFPHDVSVLEISAELEWTRGEGPLDARPLNILDDGALLYYRDKEERLKELTDSERSDLEGEENRRLNRELPYAAALPAARPAKEKGLKIYFSTE